jgi:intracellular septation protein A
MKPFTLVTVAVLALVAIAHLIRLALGWEVTVNELDIPGWASGIAVVVSGGLAFMLWRESRKA